MKISGRIPWIILLSSLLASKAIPQAVPPPALNPTTYKSPSGEYQLLVDPSDLYGRGPANYRLSRNGQEVWKGERPYTLCDAAVGNDGVSAGFAYTEGLEGFARKRSDRGQGEFVVVILDPAGNERVRHTTERKTSRFLHTRPDPHAKRWIFDPERDRLSVLIVDPDWNRGQDIWWGFQLSTGKYLGEKAPDWNPPPVEPAPLKNRPDELAAVPERKLTYLGKTDLGADRGQKPAVRDVAHFDIDGLGRIGFIRREENRRFTFGLVEPTGKVLKEVPLDPMEFLEPPRSPACAWLEGDRWLLYASPTGIEAKSRAFRIDAQKATVDEIRGFDCPSIESLSGFGDGGFVVVAATHFRFTIEDELIAFDGSGRALWRIGEDHRNTKSPAAIFSPKAVSVTSRKEVALLSNIRNTVQFFDRSGAYLRTIDLAKAWSRKPNYPAEVAATPDGGLFAEDFNAPRPLVWMAADGTIRREAAPPKTADGRASGVRDFRIAPDGRLWGCDGSSLLRVTEEGIVDLVLGSPPDPGVLEKVAGSAIDRRDQLYAVDSRTGAVHVFSPEGKKLRVCVPDPGDLSGPVFIPDIAPTDDGTVYLEGDRHREKGHLQFSPDGHRVGRKEFRLDAIKEEWHAQPATGNFWVIGYHFVFLVDPSGKLVRTIERGADGNWLEYPGPAQVLPDGGIAIAVARGQGRNTISLHAPTGDAIRTVHLPQSLDLGRCFAYAGRDFVARREKDLFIFDGDGKPVSRLEASTAGDAKEIDSFFLARGGRELWVIYAGEKAVHRFEMP